MTLYHIVSLVIILIFSIILSVQDIKHMEVGVYIQWASIFCALICHIVFARHEMWIFIISSMILGAMYFLVRKITRGKLGPADVWFGFFQGLFLHPLMLWVCLAIETVLALVVENRKIGHQKFPFIPYMAAGLVGAYLLQVFRGTIF
ncbi:MAG: hypothetical protein J5726_01680 [Treponema sp.]|nr:hypothetical protein [Treponema sp.]